MFEIKFIKNTLNKIASQEEKKILGRWNIDYCNKKLNKKVDLSNEDHCGPCGQYILDKNTNTKTNKIPIPLPNTKLNECQLLENKKT